MKRLIAGTALVTTSLALAACGGGGDGDANVVDVTGNEYAYVMPERVEGGWTTFRLANEGDEMHEYALLRIEGGRTIDDVKEFLADPKAQEQGPPEWATIVTGVPGIAGGEEVRLTQKLEPGRYAFICFVPAPDGKPHFAHGMLRAFDVVGDSDAEAPKADATVELGDRLAAPELDAGERTIELRNAEAKPAAAFLLSLDDGKSLEDLDRWEQGGLKGDPPARFLGGVIDVPPRASVYYTLELEEGREYTLFDDERGIERSFRPR